ncbi:hypothetical protein [Streptomyces sp. NPDC088847]|uniref:hypothetical protein n=1 Tax=Streptomyces sp. NPDC088847 TaxID=3365909 RepID=UPI00380CDBF3
MSFSGFSKQEGPATPNALAPTSAAAKAMHLMYLEVATEAGNAALEPANDAATSRRAGCRHLRRLGRGRRDRPPGRP